VGEEPRDVQVDGATDSPRTPPDPPSDASRAAIERESIAVLEFAKITDALRGFAASPLGRSAADAVRPTLSFDQAALAIEATSEMRTLVESRVRLPIGSARDVRTLLDRLHERGRPLEVPEILEIAAVLEASRALCDLLLGLDAAFARLRAIAPRLARFEDLLETFDLVLDPAGGGMSDEASPRLREIRDERRALERRLSQVAHRLATSSRLRQHLQSATVTQRNGRFVLPVRAESRFAVRGILHDRSHSGSTVFVEPEELVEPGNELLRLRTEETKEETRILWEVTRDVLAEERFIREALEAVSEIDLLQAKARLSVALDASAPVLVPDGRLELWQARHPILTLLHRKALDSGGEAHAVVPIDVRVGAEFHVLVITGPNTGGKTVTLKTVGLIALMARAGMHVPARAGSRVTRIVRILKHAGPKTLVLLDELGAGTDPAEGAALSLGILDFLYGLRVPALVTTHIGSLKAYAFTHPSAQNASVEFDAQTLSPTYRLSVGLAGQSNALAIACRLGMPSEVVAGAESALARERPEAHELIEDLQATRTAAEASRRHAEELREDADRRSQALDRAFQDLEMRRASLSREADAEVDRVLKGARERVLPIAGQLRNAPRPFDELARRLCDHLSEALRSTPLHERRLALIRTLKKDDYVHVPRLGQRGRVRKIDAKKGVITLQLGSMSVDVPFDDVGLQES
jgi:DNA mismatch repair protein MutS2